MRAIHDNDDRLVLRGSSPLFRPFFLGGLGLLTLGAGLLIAGPISGRSTAGPPTDAGGAAPLAGIGAFLSVFGLFVAIVPVIGRLPFRKEVIVDRAAGRLIRRDRTLLRLRQEAYPLEEIRGVVVEEARHVDGDPYFTLSLRLESGQSVSIDRFTDPADADTAARLIRDHLGPGPI